MDLQDEVTAEHERLAAAALDRRLPYKAGESRYRLAHAMSVGLQLILSSVVATIPAVCSWAHPGANPYRGDPVHALADFEMPVATRQKLRALMAAHHYTDVATITRDDIAGDPGYTDLREMHSGRGRVCHGLVDRSAWAVDRRERGLVYCADDICVIVPTICNNVSLVSRKPDRVAVLDDTPIDIAPAAGPKPPPADTPASTQPDSTPLDFFPTPEGDGGLPGAPASPGGGFNGGGGGFPGGGGGATPCCDTGPTGPIGPGSPATPPITPTSPVPEAPTWSLLIAGAALIAAVRRRRR